jgi:serine/threonine protein kinase
MMSRTPSTLAVESSGQLERGAMVDGYRVEKVLSVGVGNCLLVQAVAPGGAHVALKLVGDAAADPEERRRVLRLVRARASIAHPHLARLIGAGEHEGRLYIVSELPVGRTLAERLREGVLPTDEAVRLAAGVASALEAAARQRLVHAELSPQSIHLADESPAHALLTDFGIGRPRVRPLNLRLTVEEAEYRAPEEIRGEPSEPKSNAYSLACVLFECLTGAPPYAYDRPILTLHAHLVEPPPRPSTLRPDLPSELDDVFARAMAKEPAPRLGAVALVRGAAEALDVRVELPRSVGAPAEKRSTRRPRRPTAPKPRPRPRPHTTATAKPPPSPRRAPRKDPKPPGRRGVRSRPALAVALLALIVSALGGFILGRSDPVADPPAPTRVQPQPATAQMEQAEYVRSVSPVIDRLSTRRTAARRKLSRARRPEHQAEAARALVRAYADARRQLSAEPPASLEGARLRDQLRSAERAYRRLAAAAQADNPRAWRAASKAAVEHERSFQRSLRTLTTA